MDELTQGATRKRGLLLLGVVFVLGMVCGAALFFTGQRSMGSPDLRGHPQEPPLDRMSRELDLDADQRRAIETILRNQRARFQDVLEDSREEILDVLRPDQQESFERLRPPRPGPPGHPPPHPPGPHRGPPPRGGHPPPGQPPPHPPPESAP